MNLPNYNSADLFVMPSFSEGSAIAYLEAPLRGIPIIDTKGIAEESISAEDYGFFMPDGDAEGVPGAIERALVKKWDRRKIVKHAQSFSWDRRISEFENAYREIVTSLG